MIYHLVLPSVKLHYSLTTPRFIILFVVLEIFHCFKMIYSATLWSTRYNMSFNQKRVSTYINAKVITNYKIPDTQVLTNSSHKNLGIIISSDLSWDQHYKNIILKTYRMLGLLHRSFSKHQTVTAKRTLYISLVRLQVIYCSVIWKPNHIKQGRIQEGGGGGGLWGLKPPFIFRLYLINTLRIKMKFSLNIII